MNTPSSYSALQFEACGDPAKVLSLGHAFKRTLEDGEVLVRMLASPVNPADLNFIQGVYGRSPEFVEGPEGRVSFCGMEGCGVVMESRDPSFDCDDKVMVLSAVGTWGEYLVTPGRALLRIDPAIPLYQAAMLKVNPMTAWRLLMDFVALRPGDWIALNAANSGVGRCVIQIARLLGFRTVSFVRQMPERLEELRSLGADVVLEDAGVESYRDALDILGAARPVLGINAVGGASATNLLQLLGPGGCMVTYGGMSLRNVQVTTSMLIFKNLQVRGFWLSEWMKRADHALIRKEYDMLGEWSVQGRLAQAVDNVYPLREFQAALARSRAGFRRGRVLFDITQ